MPAEQDRKEFPPEVLQPAKILTGKKALGQGEEKALHAGESAEATTHPRRPQIASTDRSQYKISPVTLVRRTLGEHDRDRCVAR